MTCSSLLNIVDKKKNILLFIYFEHLTSIFFQTFSLSMEVDLFSLEFFLIIRVLYNFYRQT